MNVHTTLPTLESLCIAIREFADERDWGQFHTPKNLATALIVEAAELLEHFQWLTAGQSLQLDTQTRQDVKEEIADVLIYLVRLADVLKINLLEAASEKMQSNASKYPIEKSRSNSVKYNRLNDL